MKNIIYVFFAASFMLFDCSGMGDHLTKSHDHTHSVGATPVKHQSLSPATHSTAEFLEKIRLIEATPGTYDEAIQHFLDAANGISWDDLTTKNIENLTHEIYKIEEEKSFGAFSDIFENIVLGSRFITLVKFSKDIDRTVRLIGRMNLDHLTVKQIHAISPELIKAEKRLLELGHAYQLADKIAKALKRAEHSSGY